MRIHIDEKILARYPNVEIGFLTAQVCVKKQDPFVEALKESLTQHLNEKGIHATNFAVHPQLSIWRKIYKEDFQESSYRSSLEALVRRLATGKALWNICNVVDLYNCCSVLSLMPMGGYDLSKVTGDIAIRYAREGETFHGIGEKKPSATKPQHVVYADDQRVLCWLWNYKDALETCIDEETRSVIFFLDSVEAPFNAMQSALIQLQTYLARIQAVPLASGILTQKTPAATIGGN